MLDLYLEYYGEYAEHKYRDIYLYDEQGVYMKFNNCYIALVQYKEAKKIKITDNVKDACSYVGDAVKLIPNEYKVREDGFYTKSVCWCIDGKVRLARKLDLTKRDNFSFPAQRQDFYSIYENRKRDLYIYAERDSTLDANCQDVGYVDKMVTAYRDVACLTGNISVDGTYYQYLKKDAPFEGEVIEKSRLTNGHKCVTDKIRGYTIEDVVLSITTNNVRTVDSEFREKTKSLAEAIRTKAGTFRLKDITHTDVEEMLKHFDIKEK